MAIFEMDQLGIREVEATSFGAMGVKERADLQRLLRDKVEVVAPDVLVIAEEFGEWTDSRRRIDLLGVDKDANLVVIELKRTEDGGHMELQAVRYAAMVSTLTAARAIEILDKYLKVREREEEAEQLLLEFLGWDELDEDEFAQDVRIVLVSADFSRELTTAVMWLNDKELDVRCVRIRPYSYAGKTLVDVQQVIPLPEAVDYQVRVREKKRQERHSRKSNADFTRYDITIGTDVHRAQWKRNAVLLVVKRLCADGVSPAKIEEALAAVGRKRTWHAVDGDCREPEEFRAAAVAQATAQGKRYDDRRWHTREGDLIVADGHTYAFSNQWGTSWLPSMQSLKKQFPAIELSWTPSGQD